MWWKRKISYKQHYALTTSEQAPLHTDTINKPFVISPHSRRNNATAEIISTLQLLSELDLCVYGGSFLFA